MDKKNFKHLFSANPNPCWAINDKGVIEVANHAAAQCLGYKTSADLEGKSVVSFSPAMQPDETQSQQKLKTILENSPRTMDWMFSCKDGTTYFTQFTLHQSQPFTFFYWDYRPPANSDQELQRIFNDMQDVYYQTDINGIVIKASPSAEQMMDAKLSSLLGKKLEDLYVDPNGRNAFLQALQEGGGLMWNFETQLKKSDGTPIWVSTNSHFIFDQHGNVSGVEGAVRNIDSVKFAEQKAKEELNFRSELLEHTAEGICLWHLSGTAQFVEFIIWNHQMEKMTGYTQKEINRLGWLDTMYRDEENKALAKQVMTKVIQGELNKGTDFRITTKSGEYRHLHISSSPTQGPNNEPAVLAMVEDVSDRLQLEQQLQQAQKMEAIGVLVGGIAHDFNNMLAAIQGNVFLGKEKTDCLIASQKFNNIETISVRAADMVKQLLTFARKDNVEMHAFHLHSFLKEAYKLAQSTVPENIEHSFETSTEVLNILGNPTQIQQALMNLLNNAMDATQDCVQPKIKTRLQKVLSSPHLRNMYPTLKGEAFACLSIQDNGLGIPVDELTKVFEPFFSTKGEHKGTGLGLAMVYGIITAHGGVIDVESEEGVGTQFTIYLPLTDEKIAQDITTCDSTSGGKGQTILVVDDEPELRATTAEVLQLLEYQTIQASNGQEALEIIRENKYQFSLVLSDIVMPIMGGVELLEEVRKFDAFLPFILATGYDKSFDLAKALENEYCHMVNKPFAIPALAELIRTNIRTLLKT